MHEYVALRTRSHGGWGSAAAVAWAAKGRAGGAPRRFDVMGRDVHDYLARAGRTSPRARETRTPAPVHSVSVSPPFYPLDILRLLHWVSLVPIS